MKRQKMRKMRIAVAAVLAVMVCLAFTACGDDGEVMTAKEFKTAMEDKGFTVSDQTSSAADDSYQNIYVALKDNKYQFEYYFMNDEGSAGNVYEYAVSELKNKFSDGKGVVTKELSIGSKQDYSIQAEGYYIRVIQKKNSVLYITAYKKSKDECKEVLKELGY